MSHLLSFTLRLYLFFLITEQLHPKEAVISLSLKNVHCPNNMPLCFPVYLNIGINYFISCLELNQFVNLLFNSIYSEFKSYIIYIYLNIYLYIYILKYIS